MNTLFEWPQKLNNVWNFMRLFTFRPGSATPFLFPYTAYCITFLFAALNYQFLSTFIITYFRTTDNFSSEASLRFNDTKSLTIFFFSFQVKFWNDFRYTRIDWNYRSVQVHLQFCGFQNWRWTRTDQKLQVDSLIFSSKKCRK